MPRHVPPPFCSMVLLLVRSAFPVKENVHKNSGGHFLWGAMDLNKNTGVERCVQLCPVLFWSLSTLFSPLPPPLSGHSFPYIYLFWPEFHFRRNSRAEWGWKICPVSREVSLFKVPTWKHATRCTPDKSINRILILNLEEHQRRSSTEA